MRIGIGGGWAVGCGFRLQEKWDQVEEERVVCASFCYGDNDEKECCGWDKERDIG